MHIVLLVAALVCFILATVGGYAGRGDGGGRWWAVSVGWLGLALVTVDWLLLAIPH